MLATIRSRGSVDEPKLAVKLESNAEISEGNGEEAERIISALFNLDLELSRFYEEVKTDTVLPKLARKLIGLRSPTTPTVFEALVDSVIEQQISLKVAHSLERNVIKSFGDTLMISGETYHAFPTPQKLAGATTDQLRRCA
jgi:DNA-3-methyladenine glycosylase II